MEEKAKESTKLVEDLKFKEVTKDEPKKELVMCIRRYVDCSARGGYDPQDMCKQTCMQKEVKPVTTGPVMCTKRYVDCSKRGGYDPQDQCNQTCVYQEDQKVEKIVCTA